MGQSINGKTALITGSGKGTEKRLLLLLQRKE